MNNIFKRTLAIVLLAIVVFSVFSVAITANAEELYPQPVSVIEVPQSEYITVTSDAKVDESKYGYNRFLYVTEKTETVTYECFFLIRYSSSDTYPQKEEIWQSDINKISGTFDNSNISWIMDSYKKSLTISGKGELNEHTTAFDCYSYHGNLINLLNEGLEGLYFNLNDYLAYQRCYANKLCINEGVTKVGNFFMPNSNDKVFEDGEWIDKEYNDVGDDLRDPDVTSLKSIYLPRSLKSIGDYAFYDQLCLTDIYFAGTKEEWEQIKIGKDAFSSYSTGKQIPYTVHYAIDCNGNHTWSEWKTVKEPTSYSFGQYKRTCSVCGKIETNNKTFADMLVYNGGTTKVLSKRKVVLTAYKGAESVALYNRVVGGEKGTLSASGTNVTATKSGNYMFYAKNAGYDGKINANVMINGSKFELEVQFEPICETPSERLWLSDATASQTDENTITLTADAGSSSVSMYKYKLGKVGNVEAVCENMKTTSSGNYVFSRKDASYDGKINGTVSFDGKTYNLVVQFAPLCETPSGRLLVLGGTASQTDENTITLTANAGAKTVFLYNHKNGSTGAVTADFYNIKQTKSGNYSFSKAYSDDNGEIKSTVTFDGKTYDLIVKFDNPTERAVTDKLVVSGGTVQYLGYNIIAVKAKTPTTNLGIFAYTKNHIGTTSLTVGDGVTQSKTGNYVIKPSSANAEKTFRTTVNIEGKDYELIADFNG